MSNDKVQPGNFERSLVEFFERVVESQEANDLPRFRVVLDQHFGQDASALTVVSEAFESSDHPNLHLSIEEYLASPNRSSELIGVVSDHGQYAGITFAHMLAASGSGYGSVARGPVEYANLNIGPGELLPCVQLGLYLVREGDQPFALLVRGPNRIFSSEINVEVMASDNTQGHRLLGDLRKIMRNRSVYRGHVLSLGINENRAISVTFHTLPRIERDEIILPEGLLNRVERQTVRFTANADRLRNAGRHLKRGLLLHGPPGTGKTLTAMYLANRMRDRTVLLLTGQGFGLLGHSCRMARALQPSMVVLEDVDLVAEERTREGTCTPLLFELLNEMDGLADDADVLFLLTTNRPDILEPALAARPGRVDLAIEVPLPDAVCRRRLFDLYSRGLQMRITGLDGFIARTEGASGAFVRELLRKAALIAADEDREELIVEDRHLEEALRELVVDGGQLTRSLLGASMSEKTVSR